MKIKIKIIIINLFISLCIANTIYASDIFDYHLVINQGNATSHAILYKVNSQKNNAQPELVVDTFITNVSAVQLLGISADIKHDQDAILMMQFCIAKLQQQYKQISDDEIHLKSIIVGISKYNAHANNISEHNDMSKKENYHAALVDILNKNNFFCDNSEIKYMQDTRLIAENALTIANNKDEYLAGLNDTKLSREYSINNLDAYKNYEEYFIEEDPGSWYPHQAPQPIKNIWCYFITDNTMLYSANLKAEELTNTIDINDILIYQGKSYNELGKQTAKLFSKCINTKSSLGKTETQKTLSNSKLGNDILSEQSQSLAYWLKPSLSSAIQKNNTRGLAICKYILSNGYYLGCVYDHHPSTPLCQGHFLSSKVKSTSEKIKPIKSGSSWGINSNGDEVYIGCPSSCDMYGKTKQEIDDTIPQQIPIYAEDNLTSEQKQDVGITKESEKGGWTDDSFTICYRLQYNIIKDDLYKLKQLINNNISIGENDLIVFLGDSLFINNIINEYCDMLKTEEYQEIANRIIIANKKVFVDSLIQTAYKISEKK